MIPIKIREITYVNLRGYYLKDEKNYSLKTFF